MSGKNQKSWLSPFLAVTYITVALSGVIMLFHAKFPGLYPVHKWGGLLFVVAGITHLLLNWRIFTSYFKGSRAIWGSCIGLVAMIVIAVTFPSDDHGHNRHDGLRGDYQYGGGMHRRF